MSENNWYTEEQVKQIRENAYQHGLSQTRDSYLSQISDESLSVLEQIGAEAPRDLNQYALELEDALLEQTRILQETESKLIAAEKLLGIFKKEPEDEKEPEKFKVAGKLRKVGQAVAAREG